MLKEEETKRKKKEKMRIEEGKKKHLLVHR